MEEDVGDQDVVFVDVSVHVHEDDRTTANAGCCNIIGKNLAEIAA